jgi:hypothetical protein
MKYPKNMFKKWTDGIKGSRFPRTGKEVHPKMTKKTIWVASLLTVAFLLLPTLVSAEPVQQRGTSTANVGTNQVRWDSNFVHNNYGRGTPVTMKVDWSGTERIAGMVSIGLARQFSPAGAKGEIIGIERLGQDSALVTMRFTHLHKTRGKGVANAFLHINLAVDDGTGRIVVRPFPVKCHVAGGD